MRFSINKLSVTQLQWLVWACVFFIVFFTSFSEDSFAQSILNAVINTTFYAAIIYGNISYLYPRFYEKGHKLKYAAYVAVYVVIFALIRGFLLITLYNSYFAKQPEKITVSLLLTFIASATLDYLLSLIFRIALAYFNLKQKSEEILLQKSKAELKLLKSQVQPHFLFNTLNNIYYEAYTESPKTAGLIEKLSDIMRYFCDESPKDQVHISSEIKFLENYIELERIRIRYGVDIRIEKKIKSDFLVPPMLLITFVENIFKHGIDKQSTVNKIEIRLEEQEGYFIFQTLNKKVEAGILKHGFGLKNLRERLHLLYYDNFVLTSQDNGHEYAAYLKIPVP